METTKTEGFYARKVWEGRTRAAGYFLNYWTEAKDATAPVKGAFAGP